MPYRAMFSTIVTAALALVAITMWVWSIAPFLEKATKLLPATSAIAATAPFTPPSAATTSPDAATQNGHPRIAPLEETEAQDANRPGSPERMFRSLVRGVLLLSFVLMSLLLIVGFAATFREWARYGTRRRAMLTERKHQKTKYVDAWSLAGQRLEEKSEPPADEELPPYG